MMGTIFPIALILWSGLFIIAGAMLMVASQLGHVAESVAAAGRASRPASEPAVRLAHRAVRRAPTRRVVRAG